MNSTMPRLGKMSLFLLCCAFVLGYRSILDLNSSSLSQKGKSLRNLNGGGMIGFVQEVVEPFLKALQDKFRDIGEANQVVQITSSPTPSDIIGNERNNTANSTADERWWCLGFCDTSPTPSPTPAPTYESIKKPEYLTSDVHCGRYFLFILTWWYQTNHIEYKIFNQDGTDFESEKDPGIQDDILQYTKKDLTDYWQCREDRGHYDAFVDKMHKRPRLEAHFKQNIVRITCMDACGGSVMCKDLTVPKVDDECYDGDLQDLLPDPDERVFPRFDYEIRYGADGEGEADTEHQSYEYNVETLKSNPVKREGYGTWLDNEIKEAIKSEQKNNLIDLFEAWSFDVDEARYNDYCNDIKLQDPKVRVECTVGLVSYIDATLEEDVGFAINKLKEFKNSLTELHITTDVIREFPDFHQFGLLKILEINANERLSGQLPTTIGGLTKLKILEINSGGLEGGIPTEIGRLQNLLLLDLGNNDFDGNIPDDFYNMRKLKALYLHKNKFTGAISTKIGRLNQLKQFSLQDNNFSGPFPNQINQLTLLKVLDLQRGGFSGRFPDITGLNKLKVVALNDNKFNGMIPENIGDLTNLEFLNLKNNTLTGIVPARLADCKKLKRLLLDLNTNLELPADLEAQLISNGIEHLTKPNGEEYLRPKDD